MDIFWRDSGLPKFGNKYQDWFADVDLRKTSIQGWVLDGDYTEDGNDRFYSITDLMSDIVTNPYNKKADLNNDIQKFDEKYELFKNTLTRESRHDEMKSIITDRLFFQFQSQDIKDIITSYI